MSHQPTFEAELRDVQVDPLDDDLLIRLEAAANGKLTELSAEELRFETSLRQILPANLNAEVLKNLELVVRTISFPSNEKIVDFPHTSSTPNTQKKHFSKWSIAAAVALIGAVSALMVPTKNSTNSAALTAGKTTNRQMAGNLSPASFNRDLSDVSDEGIIWKSGNQPHRIVRVVYKDQTTLNDSSGRTFQVEQPRVEYMLVPAKTD